MTLLLLILACSTEAPTPPAAAPTTPPAAAPTPPPAAAPAAPGSSEHAAGEHAHAAPHGGEVKSVGSVHLEAKFMPDGLLVWVTDKSEKALDTAAFAGATAMIKGEGAPQTVPFTPMGEHLHAGTTLKHGAPATAVVTITIDGQPQSVQFSTPKVGMAEHEHTSLHGGVVSMWGEYHIEYAPKDDEYRFFVSDAKRQAVTAKVSGSVTDGEAIVPLEMDATSAMLRGRMEGAGTRPVTLNVKIGEEPIQLLFAASTGNGHGSAEGEGGGHDHAAHGH